MSKVSLEGLWLSAEHIDQAQAMLAQQHPNIGGWQACGVFVPDGCQCIGKPEGDFIQILNVGGDHWVTVSNIGCAEDSIRIYDSLYTNVHQKAKQKLVKQMAYLLMPKSKAMTLEWADMQRQSGTSDCGLFAIAVATCLCSGSLPQDCEWVQNELRMHLASSFLSGLLNAFPQSKTREHQVVRRKECVRVYCHCRQPSISSIVMIQCGGCLEWYHRGCQRVPKVVTKDMHFLCKKCKGKKKQ